MNSDVCYICNDQSVLLPSGTCQRFEDNRGWVTPMGKKIKLKIIMDWARVNYIDIGIKIVFFFFKRCYREREKKK